MTEINNCYLLNTQLSKYDTSQFPIQICTKSKLLTIFVFTAL